MVSLFLYFLIFLDEDYFIFRGYFEALIRVKRLPILRLPFGEDRETQNIESSIPFGFAATAKMGRNSNQDGYLFATRMIRGKILRFYFVYFMNMHFINLFSFDGHGDNSELLVAIVENVLIDELCSLPDIEDPSKWSDNISKTYLKLDQVKKYCYFYNILLKSRFFTKKAKTLSKFLKWDLVLLEF